MALGKLLHFSELPALHLSREHNNINSVGLLGRRKGPTTLSSVLATQQANNTRYKSFMGKQRNQQWPIVKKWVLVKVDNLNGYKGPASHMKEVNTLGSVLIEWRSSSGSI